jgi:transcriptional regulator with XRE-family HTH domain
MTRKQGWADIVRAIRAELGLTQRALAERLSVTVITVQNYEAGRYKPDALVQRRLANIAPEGVQEQIESQLPAELRREGGGEVAAPRKGKRATRYSEVTRQTLVAALDTILERAPSTVVEQVADFLTSRAGKYGEEE